MNCHTLDRFRGAWLGSMFGLTESLTNRHITAETDFNTDREQIAQIIIESERWDVDGIADLLVRKKRECDRSLASLRSERVDILAEYNYYLFSLLPLTIFYGDNWNLLQKIIRRYYSKLGNLSNNLELESDTLLWSYLITSILNSAVESDPRHLAKLLKGISTDVAGKTALTTQLEVVKIAMERGASLQQLSDELLNLGNSGQTAIALSYYCFATTATDFKLSVQRASNLNPEIAKLAAILTGTISGAYNGIAGIPISWRKIANQNSAYASASQTVLDLFRAWLGIYSARSAESNLEIQAIAVPSLIQTRKSLKVISQQSLF